MTESIESGSSLARSDQSSVSELQFVNDWSELENCVNIMSNWAVEPDSQWVVDVIVDYVPRLLTQYANLLELSYALTAAVEALEVGRTASGLILPETAAKPSERL